MNVVDLRYEIVSQVRLHERIFFSLMGASKRLRHLRGVPLVHSKTEFVIEGYFRCANTFAALAFVQAQPRKIRIANHTHAPASIDRSVRLGIPTLVLIRKPSDVALSHVLKYPGLSLKKSLKWYAKFYDHIWRHKESIVVADFGKVTSDFGYIIGKVNQHFGTNFVPFRDSEQNIAKVYKRIEVTDRRQSPDGPNQISVPTQAKAQAKQRIRSQLEDVSTLPWLQKANTIYQKFSSLGV